jgi:hypothetical protein
MKKRTILNAMMAVCVAVALSGCAGKDGADGAPGAQGPQGPTGVANITSVNYQISTSDWANVATNQWSATSGSQNPPTTDLVTAFYSLDNLSFFPLPQTNIFTTSDNLTFGYKTGSALTFFYTNTGSPAGSPTATVYINAFDVPPAVMKQNPGTNWNNYTSVRSIMNNQSQSVKTN